MLLIQLLDTQLVFNSSTVVPAHPLSRARPFGLPPAKLSGLLSSASRNSGDPDAPDDQFTYSYDASGLRAEKKHSLGGWPPPENDPLSALGH